MSFAGTLRELPPESRLTGGAAAALIFSMVLPWYQVSSIGKADSRSAFQVFTWVEAAILLVAAGVLYLVWARAQRKRFHLPGGDGFIVSLAGGWVLALLIWRLFDKPSISGPTTTVGIDWGIFVALLAAGALVAAGARVRAAGRPEPANPIAEEPDVGGPGAPPARAHQRPPARAHRGHAGAARAPAGVGGRRARAAGSRGEAARAAGRSGRTTAPGRPAVLSNSPPAARVGAGACVVCCSPSPSFSSYRPPPKRRRRGRRRGTSRGPTRSSTACGPAAG